MSSRRSKTDINQHDQPTNTALRSIRCLYIDNLDLAKIATDVTAYLRRQTTSQELNKIKETLDEKISELEQGSWFKIEYDKRSKEIIHLENEIKQRPFRPDKYTKDISEVLNRWRHCSKKTSKDCRIAEIDECIEMFTKITTEHIPMSVVKIQHVTEELCGTCGSIGSLSENPNTRQLYCSKCKTGKQILSITNVREIHDESSGEEEDATETDRIEMMLERFQGKQPALHPKIYRDIESYLDSRSIMKQSVIREKIKKDPSQRYGTSRTLMEEAMRATNNERVFKDLNLVCHVIWGWNLPILTQDFIELIRTDYANTQKYYPLLRGERRSRLNQDFRLMRHLVTRGFKHQILEEYKAAATQDVLEYHEHAWEQMCRLADLPYVPLNI